MIEANEDAHRKTPPRPLSARWRTYIDARQFSSQRGQMVYALLLSQLGKRYVADSGHNILRRQAPFRSALALRAFPLIQEYNCA